MTTQAPAHSSLVSYPPQVPVPVTLMYPPADLPLGIRTSVVDTNGDGRRVLAELHDAGGVRLLLLRPDDADAFADQLKRDAAQARSGLIVPGPR